MVSERRDLRVGRVLEPEDVERMVFLANEGQIWLALQTPDDDGPTSIITIDDVFKD